MQDLTLLDNPAWHSMRGQQHELANVGEFAGRYRPDISMFAAVADNQPLDHLDEVSAPGDVVVLLSPTDGRRPICTHWECIGEVPIRQMICLEPKFEHSEPIGRVLGANDAENMLRLAKDTDPGPFEINTGRMGTYHGIEHEGELVAMAGERFKPPGWTEVSGVCTRAEARGRGYAQQLVTVLVRDIVAAQAIPFLHVRVGSPSEAAAVAAYEKLGFTHHQFVVVEVLRRTG